MKKTLLLFSTFLLLSFTEADKHCYVRVTKTWYETHKGHKKGSNVLMGAKDTAGNYYISINAYNEFQELFDSETNATLYWLYPNAFPQQDSIQIK